MKAWLLLFDLGIVTLLVPLLRLSKMHPGWLASYSWCPLVLKEFANSGHLDSIAVFLMILAVYWIARALFSADETWSRTLLLFAAAFSLSLAIGAKLFPVVLVPCFIGSTWRRFGLAHCAGAGLLAICTTAICLWPMAGRAGSEDDDVSPPNAVNQLNVDPLAIEEQPPEPDVAVSRDRQAGLKAFLSRWMMNDLIFLNLIENLTPDDLRGGEAKPWFVLVPDSWRATFNQVAAEALQLPPDRVPFWLARGTTALIFLLLAFIWARKASLANDVNRWLELIFLTLAWFWLLLPTLNPWYWLWAMPLVCFARNRVWLWMSGLLMIYYLRFYFGAVFAGKTVLSGIPYQGEVFFDYVVVWFEYVPWFVCLLTFRPASCPDRT